MRLRESLCVCLTLAGATQAVGQTIQLPSFNVFSVDTTVLVPDSGPTPMARNRRASSNTNSFGAFPRQLATRINRQVTGALVIARIHDAQLADEALLSRSAAQQPEVKESSLPPAIATADVAAEAKLASVDELRRQRDAQAMAAQQEAALIFERARQAQAAGKPAVATVYYRSAARRATGTLRQQIIAAWQSMKTAEASAVPKTNSGRGTAGH